MQSDQQKDNLNMSDDEDGGSAKPAWYSLSAPLFHIAHICSWAVIFIFFTLGFGLFLLQVGMVDGLVSNQAQRAFDNFAGKQANIKVDHTVLRLTGDGHLAVEARDVSFVGAGQTGALINAGKAQIKIDPIQMLFGKREITALNIADLSIDVAALTSAPSNSDTAPNRIDDIDELALSMFKNIKQMEMVGYLNEANILSVENIELLHPAFERLGGLKISHADLQISNGRLNSANAALLVGQNEASLELKRDFNGLEDSVVAKLKNIQVNFETNDPNPEFRSGLTTELEARLEFALAEDRSSIQISSHINLGAGTLKLGGENTALNVSDFYLEYDQEKQSIELSPASYLSVSRSRFPLTGGIIDADNFGEGQRQGYIYDLVIDQGVLDPVDTEERPIIFSAKSFGSFDPVKSEITSDELLISVRDKFVAGNGRIKLFSNQSPEISLAVNAPEIATSEFKQLWPYWLGRGARSWALNNIFGGTIKDTEFWLHIKGGRLSSPERPIRHSAENYQVDYKFENARVNVVGEVPPIRNASGTLRIRGEELWIEIQSGTSFFPSGRKMDIDPGSTFIIQNTNNVPLMADLDLNLSGQADAAAELISFKPIDALDAVGIKAEHLSGLVEGNIKATVGLNPDQSPPDPLWAAQLNLTGVDLAEPIEGRIATNVVGSLDITPKRAVLAGTLRLDNIPVKANIVEPIGKSSAISRSVALSGTLNNAHRAKLGLGVEDILFGNASFTMTRMDDARDQVSINLRNTEVVAPGTGWRKAKGVNAKVTFVSVKKANETHLEDFRFSGDGFLASGNMVLNDNGLKSAQFDRIKLAPKDNYALNVRKSGNTFNIKITGDSFDFRPLITELKKDGDKERRNDPNESSYNLTGKLNTVYGFGGEQLSGATMEFVEKSGIPRVATFTGRTRNNGSVAMQLKGDEAGETIKIASDDGGTFWRFFDIYAFVQDGALDINVSQSGNGPYKGQALMRSFKVIGDERLKTLVSTRASEKERSLNEALDGRLDVSRVGFDQMVVDFSLNNGRLDISSGIIRGPQIGASFDGMLYNNKDNMDMTGTFMPAYALNSIFGEIPVLGALLGNGRDKALLGITFRVSGNADNPRIQVNPLSAIAPGIFRNIFQF